MTRYFKAPVGSLAQRKMAEWEKKLKAEAKKITKKVKSNPTVRIPARITADGRVFVTAGAMRRLNPARFTAYQVYRGKYPIADGYYSTRKEAEARVKKERHSVASVFSGRAKYSIKKVTK